MAKKKQDSSKAAAKAAKKAKASQKVERKEKKNVEKFKTKEDEEDLETILEDMRREWEEAHTVTEEIVDGPPSRRANATLTTCPSGNFLWCIGGEFFSEDGKAYFYNDVYRYAPEKDEWRKFISKTCPGPRSAHATVASVASGGRLFLFGGEFSSLYQNSFHHYRDFWCFDVTTHTWDRIDTKTRPSARSGCRMAIWKHFIFLFGGFYDPGIRSNYLNDLWYFDTQEYYWRQIEFREGDRKPSPRSGFSFLSTTEGIVLHGGYCKEYAKGKRPVGVMLDDTWFLRITLNSVDEMGLTPSTKVLKTSMPFTVKWERRKKIGYAPSIRSGCTMTLWNTKGMGILFGGVTDEDPNEETLESVFHNDLFGYQLAGNGRWVSMTLHKPKKRGRIGNLRKANDITNGTIFENQESNEDLEEDSVRIINDDLDERSSALGLKAGHDRPMQSERDVDLDDQFSTVPRARYNTMLAVLRNTLYIYGGILELGPREYTLDDFYSLPLDKLDRFVCLKECDVSIPNDNETIESSDEDDEYDDDDDDAESNEDDGEETMDMETARDRQHITDVQGDSASTKTETNLRLVARKFLNDSTVQTPNETRSIEDKISTPLPGETLATFYARSREYWSAKAYEYSDNRGKLLRRDGFTLAQERYASYKPILEEVEKILKESGLDDDEVKRTVTGGISRKYMENRNKR